MKLEFYRRIREYFKRDKRVHYLTMDEKREMALRGEEVPICINENSKESMFDGGSFIAKEHGFIPHKTKKKMNLN